jgi:hypothetical protein
MTDHLDRMKCPVCYGQGEVWRYQLIQFFTDPELRAKIDSYLGVANPAEAEEETAEVAHGPVAESRNFQKDVHSWNPQLPMWRRGPKE